MPHHDCQRLRTVFTARSTPLPPSLPPGYCKATCGACSGGQPEVQAYSGPADSSPSPSPSPGGRRLKSSGRRLLR